MSDRSLPEPTLDLPHPRVFHDRAELARARAAVAPDGSDWARSIRADVVEAAEATRLFGRDPAAVRADLPDPGAYFLTGNFALPCPVDGSALAPVGWEAPGELVCEEGHTVPHPDHDGTDYGDDDADWVRARWNGWVATRTTEALEPLAYAYALTGDEAYACPAVAALDALADVYPTATEGPLNFPSTSVDEEGGRLARPGYQVARALVDYANAADLLWESRAFDGTAATRSGRSLREHVARNLLLDGADFCERDCREKGYDRMLHNGSVDYARGMLVVGSMFDVERYVRPLACGFCSLDRLLDNAVDRDGTYYETAGMYSHHARRLYRSVAELLAHLDATTLPDGLAGATDPHDGADADDDAGAEPGAANGDERAPAALAPYDDERLQRLFVPYAERHAVAGRIPNYGDSGPLPDVAVHGPDPREHDAPDRKELSELLVPSGSLAGEAFLWGLSVLVRADDPPPGLAAYLTRLAGGDPVDGLDGVWPLFAVDAPPAPAGPLDRRPSELLGGQGMAYLRPPSRRSLPDGHDADGDDPTASVPPGDGTSGGSNGRDVTAPGESTGRDSDAPGDLAGRDSDAAWGAMLRYGATLNHGHYDELGLVLYAAGREASLDPGYGAAHYRYGWCKHPVAHLTVAVDEATVGSGTLSGGRLNAFGRGAGASVVDASDPGAYPERDLDAYRRTVAMIDAPGGGYFVDLFRVDGGGTRDYSFHAAGTGFDTDLDLGPPADGSLAGENADWGSALDGDGNARGTGLVDGFEEEGFGFAPPPGTGYGFLGSPRRATPDGTWRATWTDDRDPAARTRLTVLPPAGGERTAVVADGPPPMADALGDDGRVPYVLARETGDAPSQFAAVVESGTDLPLAAVERLDAVSGDGTGDDGHDGCESRFPPVALRVRHGDGVRDYVASTVGDGLHAPDAPGPDGLRTDAAFAFARIDGDGVERLRMERGTRLAVGDVSLSGVPASYAATVRAVDVEAPSLIVDAVLPADGSLRGARAVVDAPAYARDSAYRIAGVEPLDDGRETRLHLDAADAVLARGDLSDVERSAPPALVSDVRLPFARSHTMGSLSDGTATRYYDGKRVVAADGAAETTVCGVRDDFRGVEVPDAGGFAAGDRFAIHDVRPGDAVTIPVPATVRRTDGGYAVDAPGDPVLDVAGDGDVSGPD